jgi:hypothetical protein
MTINDSTYVISTRKEPLRFEADARLSFYSAGEFTEVLKDAYKWIYESDANDYFKSRGYSSEDYEVRRLDIKYNLV